MNYWVRYLLILGAGLGGLILPLIFLRKIKKHHTFFENLIIMSLALFVTLMAVEFYFKVFFAQIDSLHTLARQNWYERYYQDAFNSLGYRDKEWSAEQVAGKTKVMIVGDSFVEGVGVENPDNRFSNKLNDLLGPEYVVFNLGKRGANTPQEIEAIVNYPYPPDILVLSYFINDIEDLRWWIDQNRPQDPSVPDQIEPIVNNAYAANFLYWRWYRLTQGDHLAGWWTWLKELYADPEMWWLHQQDLLSIYEGAKAQQVPLVVVVFPNLTAVEDSKIVTNPVVQLFEEQGVPTIDAGDLVRDIPRDERVVSPVDAHPSELVHRLVAQALYDMLAEMELVQEPHAEAESQ